MDFMLFIVIFMSLVVFSGGCRYGSGVNCAFQCNCNSGCNQATVDCNTSGCIHSKPAEYGWSGPGCLIGNVAYGKPSSQSSNYKIDVNPPSKGNDGNNKCNEANQFTHTRAENPAWYEVDLGSKHHIYNVTLYDRIYGDLSRIENSRIQVINGDWVNTCGTVTVAEYSPVMTFPCGMKGDKVRIYKDGDDDAIIHICELVVMGYRYTEGTEFHCTEWTDEKHILGCKTCSPGKKLPDCKEECPSGYYGVNCKYQCSNNCKSDPSPTCDVQTGKCMGGCQEWFVGDMCDTQIVVLPINNNDVSAKSTSSSITVTWKPAISLSPGSKEYYHYYIRYKIEDGSGRDIEIDDIQLIDDMASEQSYTISNLPRNTEIRYFVRSVRTVDGDSSSVESEWKSVWTKCKAPDMPSDIGMTLTVTDDEFMVSWTQDLTNIDSGCKTTNMDFTIEYKFSDTGDWMGSSISDISQYTIPADGNAQCWTRLTVVNNEGISASTNVVSTTITTTKVPITVPSNPGETDTTSTKPDKNDPDKLLSTKQPADVGMIAGVAVAAVVFVVLVVIVVLLFTRYRRSLPAFGKKKDKESKQKLSIDVKFETGKSVTPMGDVPIMPGPAPPSSPKPKPISPRPQPTAKPVVQVNTSIPVSQLGSYIAKKRKERDGFKNEYATLPEDETAPCERGSLPENKTKNRFLNIRAYDHSRVILETENDDSYSDYINCNYIPGFDGNKEHYIAGQGPKPHNIVDLWRMIWQKKINRIAMMTNEIENSRRKCDRYWPENVEGSQQYGAITVTTMGIERFPFYTIRLLRVQKDGVSRSVRHFHFTSWIDKRIPEYAFPLLGFRKKVRMYDRQSTGPLFVHCSAGVGRTGTFIAIDYLLDQAKHKHTVDVRKWVNTMRGCRINMIQTLEQYIFVYDTLLEALACGDTSIPASELETTMKQLKVKQKGEKVTPLEAQYKVIDDFRPVPKGEDFKALSEDNIHKNRDPNIYPSDLARPYLLTKSENGNDYINAVFVHGYNRSNHYLITQMPLPTTAVDFWRMVCDIDIVTIVALNEINDEDCTPYWPDENDSTETYGPIEVAFKSSQDDEIASVSTFEITNNENGGRKKEVEHIRMLNWPDNTLPDPKNLIHIVNLLEQRAQLHNEGNVVIHCLKGVSNSGILVAALNMIEKLKIDQEIDVFTAVKAIRINRNMFIESFEQYEYLYQVAQTYKAMNDTYANFS